MVDSLNPNTRPDVVAVQSGPRPTPTPVRTNFKQVLENVAVRTAQTAMAVLPGAPIMVTALRGPAVPISPAPMTPLSSPHGGAVIPAHPAVSMAPEGPGGAGVPGTPGVGGDPTGGSLDGALSQGAQENAYYLQLQERINAENRSFTALSNVMKEEHDTHKAAISNIRA
jgi:hypothetical protein